MTEQSLPFFRKLLPIFLAIALVISGSLHVQLGGRSPFPHFLSMVVFFWALYLPSAMPKIAVVFLGIFQDILYGIPLGISSVCLLLLWWFMVMQRRYLFKEPFWVLWLTYSILFMSYSMLHLLLVSLMGWGWQFGDRIVILAVLSIGYYPFMHMLFRSFYRDFLKGLADDTYE